MKKSSITKANLSEKYMIKRVELKTTNIVKSCASHLNISILNKFIATIYIYNIYTVSFGYLYCPKFYTIHSKNKQKKNMVKTAVFSLMIKIAAILILIL